ncbi:MAG TPA: sigma-54 dependent transcriptional regulator [Desulfomicrobiaceae bacterium]|nr:sigma-54 dependent transcriptional regulator [Desulfomicrobiaceae bacterium]
MSRPTTILIIDDEPAHRLMVRAVLEDAGFSLLEADNGQDGLNVLQNRTVDAVLLDMRMPGMDGLETLQHIQGLSIPPPVIMLTAYGSVGSAVEAMKVGAFDYLGKPTDNEELVAVVARAAEYARLLHENQSLKQQLRQEKKTEIIGRGERMNRILELIDQVGPTEANVLILGESGTGKELVAQAVHEASQRKQGPLIKVNCAALPENLLESELFGYVKGAFTGAVKDKPGRFQLADGGTLFLDEIGELPMNLQAKLLRALQERLVEPLGSVKPVSVDVRFLAATNRDLQTDVHEGNFREDLYYRLNVLEIAIPPLRDRIEDIPPLTDFLLRKLSKRNNRVVRSVSPEFMHALSHYPWPGNVRELENVLERALILCRSDVLGLQDLPEKFFTEGPAGPAASDFQAGTPLEEAEKRTLIQTLQDHGGHREKTAGALGMSRRTLQYKLKKYGLTSRK